MKKRIFSMIIAIAMVVGLVPGFAIAASAAEIASGTTGDCTWTFDDATGTLTISGEGEIGGDQSWGEHVDSITSIVIEDGVTSITNYAFCECSNLESVTLPSSVTTIGNYAFANCSNLKSVTIPENVTEIGNSAFYRCSSLATVNYLGKSAPEVGRYVFVACNLTTVNVPIDYEGDTFADLDVSKMLVDEPTPAYVAEVNGTPYENLVDAIEAAAATENSTLKLLADIDEYISIRGGTFTFDLNGHSITSTNDGIILSLGANITLIDSAAGGSITVEEDCVRVMENSICTINGGTFNGYTGVYVDSSRCEINGGAFNISYSGVRAYNSTVIINNITMNADSENSDDTIGVSLNLRSKCEINGGTIEADFGVEVFENSTCTINGGVIHGYSCGVYFNGGNCTVNGGTVSGDSYGMEVCSGTITIVGGTISGNDYAVDVYSDGVCTITGGSFNTDPSDYVADGHAATLNSETNMYDVAEQTVPVDPYADVVLWSDTDGDGEIDQGEATYTSINTPLASGGSYKLYRDYDYTAEGDVFFTIGTQTSLDLNGKSLCSTASSSWYLRNAKLTISDSSAQKTGNITARASIIKCLGADAQLFITGGTLTASCENTSGLHAVAIHDGTAVISGATISSDDYGVMIDGGQVNISGGTFSGGFCGVLVYDGEVNILDGTFSGDEYGVMASGGEVNISGGTISGDDALYIYLDGTSTVTGGSFSTDPSDHVADGYAATLNSETNMYDVDTRLVTITFVDTGDTSYPPITMKYGENIASLADPTRRGYTFLGWDQPFPAKMPANDMTITALWEMIKYDIVIEGESENGQVSVPDHATMGETVTLTVTPSFGYKLESITITDKDGNPITLDENNSFVMPMGGVTVNATFKMIVYATVEELTQAVEKLEELIETKADAGALTKAIDELRGIIDALDNTYATDTAVSEAIEKAKKDVTEAYTEVLNQAVDTLNKTIADGDKENADAIAKAIENLNELIESAKNAATKADENLKDDLTKAIADASTAMTEAYQKAIADAVEKLEGADKDNADALAKAIEDLEKLIDAAEEAAVAGDNTLSDKITAAMTKAEDELKEAKEKLEALVGSVQSNLDSAKTELNKAIADLDAAMKKGDSDLSAGIAALNTALASAKSALEKADADNKAGLVSKIETADAALDAAIKAVQKNLDDAKAELDKAIADGDTTLDGKIAALNDALVSTKVALEATDAANKSELTALVDEAYASLEAAIKAVQKNLDEVKAALVSKDAELAEKDDSLYTFIIIVCVIACVALVTTVTFVIWYVVDRRKKTNA